MARHRHRYPCRRRAAAPRHMRRPSPGFPTPPAYTGNPSPPRPARRRHDEPHQSYGPATVVDNVNLHVPEGAVYGFLGPNGTEQVDDHEEDPRPDPPHKAVPSRSSAKEESLQPPRDPAERRLAHRGPSCHPHLTARENLDIVRRLRGLPKDCIDEVLEVDPPR